MKKVYSESEAMDFFLASSSEDCLAINKRGEEKIVDCYPEAVKFLNS